ncbi:MAG: flagellar hook-length control protein FliK [Pseudomonadota bacterium]
MRAGLEAHGKAVELAASFLGQPGPAQARLADPETPDGEGTQVFALSLANVASVQLDRAAAAVEAHGVAPQTQGTVLDATNRTQANGATNEAAYTNGQGANTATPSSTGVQLPSTAGLGSSNTGPSATLAPNPPINIQNTVGPTQPVVPTIGALTASVSSTNPANGGRQTTDPILVRPEPAGVAARTPLAPRARAGTPTPSPTATSDFAQLVARQIGRGETRFEVRLDPPELGRIDVRYHAQENERASLTLIFEEEATRDLFRRDTDSLRAFLRDQDLNIRADQLRFDLASDQNNDRHTPFDTSDPRAFSVALPVGAALEGEAPSPSRRPGAASVFSSIRPHLIDIIA